MKLRVLSVAYPFARVGPDAVGGAEQILSQLDFALKRAGHESIVIAVEGSITAGRLVPVARPAKEIDQPAREKAWAECRTRIARVLDNGSADLVHMHGVDFYQYLPSHAVPVLVTLHLPLHWYPAPVFTPTRPNTFLHCVSESQHKSCPQPHSLLQPIENGISADFSPLFRKRGTFALSLGRICPEKGFHLALEAARIARVPAILAGEVFQYHAHQDYFRKEIIPRLDRRRCFIGPAALERKRRLLSAAHCLLAPSLVPETSSLVAMEALSCGTPVVAFPSGALANLIEHGRTGFLVENEREMARCIRRCSELSREACAETARQGFSSARMIRKYFELYAELAQIGSERLPPGGTERVACWK